MKLTIYTDGASRGNPGPSSYGYRIEEDSGKLLHQSGKYIGETTNNVAEYTGVLEALKWCKRFLKAPLRIQFFVDSRLVAEQLSGRFKVKSLHLKPIIEEIKIIYGQLGEVSFKHIPREKNTRADKLANQALDKR